MKYVMCGRKKEVVGIQSGQLLLSSAIPHILVLSFQIAHMWVEKLLREYGYLNNPQVHFRGVNRVIESKT